MNYKDNYIIDEDFSERTGKFYIVFYTPEDKKVRINDVQKMQLKRITDDSLELVIVDKNRNWIYHYTNDNIILLDKIDIGVEN